MEAQAPVPMYNQSHQSSVEKNVGAFLFFIVSVCAQTVYLNTSYIYVLWSNVVISNYKLMSYLGTIVNMLISYHSGYFCTAKPINRNLPNPSLCQVLHTSFFTKTIRLLLSPYFYIFYMQIVIYVICILCMYVCNFHNFVLCLIGSQM
jgi:hypothetical protein